MKMVIGLLLVAGLTLQTVSAAAQEGKRAKVGAVEYQGWRLFSVHCARCHGQDGLGTPVAPNLMIKLGPAGPINTSEQFADIVTAGRPASGMPAFKNILKPHQVQAMYAYLKGRAEKRIPPGRPKRPPG